jgi:hypothetical protein
VAEPRRLDLVRPQRAGGRLAVIAEQYDGEEERGRRERDGGRDDGEGAGAS